MKILLLTLVLLLLAVLMLSFRVLLVKGGRFPDGHIGHSEAMRKRGINCAHSPAESERR